MRALDELVRVLAQFRVFLSSFLHLLMSPDMFTVIAVVSAFGFGTVAVMYWQLHRQFACLQLELQRLSRQYRRTRNGIKIHQRLNTVEESQAELWDKMISLPRIGVKAAVYPHNKVQSRIDAQQPQLESCRHCSATHCFLLAVDCDMAQVLTLDVQPGTEVTKRDSATSGSFLPCLAIAAAMFILLGVSCTVPQPFHELDLKHGMCERLPFVAE